METGIIQLRKGKKGKLKPGHPWVYQGQILGVSPETIPGDIVAVFDAQGKLVGRGYYNPKSDISVRLLTFNEDIIDAALFFSRISKAWARREHLLAVTNACRIIFSEADGLPGLIADIYADTVVFQVFTLGMERYKKTVVGCIEEIVRPRYIYEKSDSPFRRMEGLDPARGWWTGEGERYIEIYEGKAKFVVDIEKGHKTGFYLDQRKSRMAVSAVAKGKRILDLFCYTGGFSIVSALAGAREAIGVDIKDEWLELGRANAALNGVSEKVRFISGDAFSVLREQYKAKEIYDIIIIDPPSFAKDKRAIVRAAKGYKELNLVAMKMLSEGGVLCTFSCSHNMSNDLFSNIIKDAAKDAHKKFTILKRCHQDQDHPIARAIPETEYLKGYFLKVESAG